MRNAFVSFGLCAVVALIGCATDTGTEITWKTVFKTPLAWSGNLGGLAGADQLCSDAAKSAGLPGTYVAWLSTSTVNAIDRVTGNGPWLTAESDEGGVVEVFASHADLAADHIETDIPAPSRDTSMEAQPGVWTGTTNQGQSTGYDCDGWTSSGLDGDPIHPTQGTFGEFTLEVLDWSKTWSQMASDDPGNPPVAPEHCIEALHLYCFED
jgi:hypothetical protein